MCEAETCPDCVCDACEDEIDRLKEQLAEAKARKIRIPTEDEQQAFCDELEKIPGILARRYDCTHRERLAVAGHAIHAWLSALDLAYQPAALRMTLAEFADTWARSRGPGLRRFEAPGSLNEAAERWRALMQHEQNEVIEHVRDGAGAHAVLDVRAAAAACDLLESVGDAK